MDRYTDHSIQVLIKNTMMRIDSRMIVAVLSIELAVLLMAASKGLGKNFLLTTLILMLFSIVTCMVSTYIRADLILTAALLILLDIGFLVQQIQTGSLSNAAPSLVKMSIAFGMAITGTVVYCKIREKLSSWLIIIATMIMQYLICSAVTILGSLVGGTGFQSARIELLGITVFEVVKFLYVLTAAGLIYKNPTDARGTIGDYQGNKSESYTVNGSGNDSKDIMNKREVILIVHTLILLNFLIMCGELGTLIIIYMTGLAALYISDSNTKRTRIIAGITALGVAGIWFVSDRFLMKILVNDPGLLPGMVSKIVSRFGAALHPELYASGSGYQSLRGLEAIVMGGWFGIETERYRMPLPEAVNDFIFDNIVQTCGMLIGILVIILFMIILKRGMAISEKCDDSYSKMITFIISFMIALQAIIHIGYNISILPVTGIPLYFVSQGFTALTTGMLFIGILLVVSGENNKRMGTEA